jgi:hypothetical protein
VYVVNANHYTCGIYIEVTGYVLISMKNYSGSFKK